MNEIDPHGKVIGEEKGSAAAEYAKHASILAAVAIVMIWVSYICGIVVYDPTKVKHVLGVYVLILILMAFKKSNWYTWLVVVIAACIGLFFGNKLMKKRDANVKQVMVKIADKKQNVKSEDVIRELDLKSKEDLLSNVDDKHFSVRWPVLFNLTMVYHSNGKPTVDEKGKVISRETGKNWWLSLDADDIEKSDRIKDLEGEVK